MRKVGKITLVLFGLLFLITLTFGSLSSCTPAGETIRDRINTFISAVNNQNEQGVKDCLDSSASDYSTASLATTWNNHYTNRPYSITTFSTSGNTATVQFSGTSGTLDDVFQMTETAGTFLSGTTYKIKQITTSASTVIFQ
jgi:N-methylhydantoinase B/oxoprolinase/acetone carboxylase alpha subunit